MSVARRLLGLFRELQYRMYGRSFVGVMSHGDVCSVEDRTPGLTHGDVVHPCVRYIEECFEGHKWWMVYTPYYAANASLENPILCYGDSETDEAPKRWFFCCVIQPQQSRGYNSDPTMFFRDGRLFVFWRENETPRTDAFHCCRATFGGEVKAGKLVPFENPLLVEPLNYEDRETCPTIIPSDGSYMSYAMHLRFFSSRLRSMKGVLGKLLNRCAVVLDLLGVCSQQKSYGIAIWTGDTLQHSFSYKKTVRFKGVNKLYRPWHMDFFDYDGVRYAIVQTNQSNADLCLAKSTDGETFTFFKKPLITNRTIDMVGIYKPTALVVDDVFYLYYTAQDKDNRALNKLYMTKMSINQILNSVQ